MKITKEELNKFITEAKIDKLIKSIEETFKKSQLLKDFIGEEIKTEKSDTTNDELKIEKNK